MGIQLFDQVVEDLPPSTVDVAGIVRREKRRSAVRHAMGLATAVVTLSVTTALGLSMTGDTGASSSPSVAGGVTAPGSAAPDTRFALVSQDEESAAASAKRLRDALDTAFRKEAPGAKWIFEPGEIGETGPDGQPPKLSYHVAKDAGKSEELFGGGAGVLNEGRKGSLRLGVEPATGVGEDGIPRPKTMCSPSAQNCTEGTAPNGAKTLFMSKTYDGVQWYSIEVKLPDGRTLKLTHSNNFGADGGGAAQNGTPLTSDQLKAIAIDVASQIKA